MKPDISEFSFGYAVTEALAQRWRPTLTAAPVFPSLVEEGKVGYDVKLVRHGIPFFLQFKLSEYMVRTSAREVRNGLLDVPFYRMHLRPTRHSDQHKLLCDLEATGQLVRYVAPMFHTTTEFNDAYLQGQILQRSIFLRPLAIGPLPDGDDHHVAFESRKSWCFLSEPRWGQGRVDEEAFDGDVRVHVNERGVRALTEQALYALTAQMVEMISRRRAPEHRRDVEYATLAGLLTMPDPLLQVAYLSRTFFGAECVVVWEATPSPRRS